MNCSKIVVHMPIHLLTEKATSEQLSDMLLALGSYVKLAVDVELGILAGGGELHADCESILLDDGSEQDNVWGADWFPHNQETTYESMINYRPRLGFTSMELQDERLRTTIKEIAKKLLGGVKID
jgi:hypothetical protein